MGRLFTSQGDFVGVGKLPNAFRALNQAIRRKTRGEIPRLPWIPFAAIDELDRTVRKDWRVWEVGAGFSTLWLADRVGQITSIEASKEWFDKLSSIVQQEQLAHVDLRHEWHGDKMSDFSELEDETLDLLFIDGGPRAECLINGFAKVKRGGAVYLDNWENDNFWLGARDFPASQDRICSMQQFIDYVPAQVGVYKGLLLTKT